MFMKSLLKEIMAKHFQNPGRENGHPDPGGSMDGK